MNKNVKKLLGKRFISGSWGELWWDGVKIQWPAGWDQVE